MWRYLIAALLALHGLVYAIGFAASWQVATMAGVSSTPSFRALESGSSPVLVLGALWLAAGPGFVVGAIGLIARRSWWFPTTAAAAVLSLVLTAMWWQSAPIGIAIDVVVLGFLLLLTSRPRGALLTREGFAA
jgi:hypothetical protein